MVQLIMGKSFFNWLKLIFFFFHSQHGGKVGGHYVLQLNPKAEPLLPYIVTIITLTLTPQPQQGGSRAQVSPDSNNRIDL